MNKNKIGRSIFGRSFRFWVICCIGIWLITSCQPAATPVANVVPPTNTPDTSATLPPPVRYVLGINSQQLDSIQTVVSESALLIPISGLTEDSVLGTDYDIIADYGIVEGWQQSPILPTVSLIINPNITPLDNDNIAQILRTGIDGIRIINRKNISGTAPLVISSIQISSLKTELANMGYPDGFELRMMSADIPYTQATIDEIQNLNIELIVSSGSLEQIASLLVENRLHLALIKWHSVSEKATWTSAVGEANVIDLYQLPISYLATPDLNITFADNGFPIASY